MENFGKFVTFIILIITSLLTAILAAYVILQIAGIYKIDFITQFNYLQMYAIVAILGMIINKNSEKKETTSKKKNFNDVLKDGFAKVIGTAIGYLCAWGIMYLVYIIFA